MYKIYNMYKWRILKKKRVFRIHTTHYITLRENGYQCADHIFKSFFLYENCCSLIQISPCRQATSQYLNQSWSRSMLPYGITRSRWVNLVACSLFNFFKLKFCSGGSCQLMFKQFCRLSGSCIQYFRLDMSGLKRFDCLGEQEIARGNEIFSSKLPEFGYLLLKNYQAHLIFMGQYCQLIVAKWRHMAT